MGFKLLLVISALFVANGYATDGQNLWQTMHTDTVKCAEELNINRDSILENLRNGNKLSEDPNFKCLGACMLKKIGVMDNYGKINKDKITNMVPANASNRDEIIVAMSTCLDQRGSDECETTHKIFQCMVQKAAMAAS